MKQVFLVSLVGSGVAGGRSVLGFLSSNDKEMITNYIKNMYKIKVKHQLQNKFSFQNGNHWEYITSNLDVDVHVDLYYNLDEYENK